MIGISNPAFELLRTFKDCSEETEKLVTTMIRKRFQGISNNELKTIFENGIAGEYGKVYALDPQTLLAWIKHYWKTKNAPRDYLESGLLPVNTPSWEVVEWDKEANKCYKSFLNGASHEQFHPCVYDRMMIDGKIQINAYLKYLPKETVIDENLNPINEKQKVIRDVFTDYRSKGFTTVYFIK